MWAMWIVGAWAGPTLTDAVALHVGVDGRVVDQTTVAAVYEAACAEEKGLSCKWRSWDDYGRPRLADLQRLTTLDCEKGDQQACVALAWALGLDETGAWGPDDAIDPTRAAVLVQQACDSGLARGCVELGRMQQLGFALPTEPDRARANFEASCEAGVAMACMDRAELGPGPEPWLEAALELGAPHGLEPAEACAAGVVSACEKHLDTTDGAERLEVLDRLCHMRASHCPALAEALASAQVSIPETLPDRDPDYALTVAGGAMLGWRGASWSPLLWLPPEAIDVVRIRVVGPRREGVEIALGAVVDADGEPRSVTLPTHGCGDVVRQVQGLEGHPARAVDAGGLPMASTCIDALPLGGRPEYVTGLLSVDADNTDFLSDALALRERASDASEGLFACGDAVDRDAVLNAFVVQIVVKRDGTVSKVKVEASSGDAGFDTCVTEWLMNLEPVEEITLTTKLRLTTRLLW